VFSFNHFQKYFKFLSLSLSLSLSLPSQVSIFIQPFPKIFQIPFSLSLSLLSLSSHPTTTLVRRQIAPPLWGQTAPTSSKSSKLSGILSFSLYPSLPHSFSHLTCSVVHRQNRAPSPVLKRPAHSVATDRHLQGRLRASQSEFEV
jgi:hypothetical protein